MNKLLSMELKRAAKSNSMAWSNRSNCHQCLWNLIKWIWFQNLYNNIFIGKF